MPKGTRLAPRQWECKTCEFVSVALWTHTGPPPDHCPPCKRVHLNRLQREALARRPGASEAHQRTYRLKRYGITQEQYEAMVERAAGSCEACGDVPAKLFVDHCHERLVGRGMLCHPCNVAAGFLKNDLERCLSLAAYLERAA